MGLPPQPDVRTGISGLHGAWDRRGMALPVSLLAVVAIGLLAAGAWVVVDLNARSMANRESSARALQLAEAGAAHAASVLEEHLSDRTLTVLLLGSDSLPDTDDDGLLMGFGMPEDVEIPEEGFVWGDGRYKVTFLDDPNEGDGDDLVDLNGRILIRCRGKHPNGATATVDLVYGSDPTPPAVVVNGDLAIGGSVQLLGSCGGVYTNGVAEVSNLVVEYNVVSADSVVVSGSIEDPDGNEVTPLMNQATITVPTYDVWNTCPGADYILDADGWITVVATGEEVHANTGNGAYGWVQKTTAGNTAWELVAAQVVEATFCIDGNAKMDGSLGSAEDPFVMTVFATGGITATGNLVIMPDHPEGFLLMAQGDLKIAGNVSGAAPELTNGLLYAGSQCHLSGNPSLSAQIFCADEPDPAGAADYAASNEISGNVQFIFDCPPEGGLTRRVLSWSQRYGS